MEANDNEKAAKTIYGMYCRKHDIDPVIKTKEYDKVDRQKVDEHLFETRVVDDDPLIDTGENYE